MDFDQLEFEWIVSAAHMHTQSDTCARFILKKWYSTWQKHGIVSELSGGDGISEKGHRAGTDPLGKK